MARRRKSTSSEGEWVVVVIGGILLVLAKFIKAILFFFVNALAWLGLPALLFAYQHAKNQRDEIVSDPNKQVPDPNDFEWHDGQVKITYLTKLIEDDELAIEGINHHADEKGLRRTDASDGKRFDQRNKLGVQFNKALDNLEHRLSTLRSTRREIRQGVLRSVPAWQEPHDEIVSAMAECEAIRLSLWIYGGVFLTLLIFGFGWVNYLSGFAFSPLASLKVLFGPAALATVAAGISILFLKGKYREEINPTLHVEQLAVWSRIEHDIKYGDKFVSLDAFFKNEGSPDQSEESDEDFGTEEDPFESDDGRDWHEVLGVEEDASKDEIRTAWKRRIQKYHPDGVANLGPVMTALAEQETVLLNQAYQHAKKIGRA